MASDAISFVIGGIVGVGVGLLVASRKKSTTDQAPAPAPEQTLPPTDQQQPRLTDDQIVMLEFAAFHTTDRTRLGNVIEKLNGSGVNAVGLGDYVRELQGMTPNVAKQYEDGIKKATKQDTSPLTDWAKNVSKFYPQAARQAVLLAHRLLLPAGEMPAAFAASVRATAETSASAADQYGKLHGVPGVIEWIEA